MSIFFRILSEPPHAKGDALAERVAALNAGAPDEQTYTAAATDFGKIPGSPFAYWVNGQVISLFSQLAPLQGNGRQASSTNPVGDDQRYFRTHWEIPTILKGRSRWVPLAKGGSYSGYFGDIHLVVDWDEHDQSYRGFEGTSYRPLKRPASLEQFFRPGLTWSRRTIKGLTLRALPKDCIFADKGPAIFVDNDDEENLLGLLALTNSLVFKSLIHLQMTVGSYEVGVIQRTPVPDDLSNNLPALALQAHNLQRENYTADETTHVFGIPAPAARRAEPTLAAAAKAHLLAAAGRGARLAAVQEEIDRLVSELYGLGDLRLTIDDLRLEEEVPSDEEEEEPGGAIANRKSEIVNLLSEIENLLMWCVGVAFGRWDARYALDPSLPPLLPGPFDPLPRYAPGAITNYELRITNEEASSDLVSRISYPVSLVDDPGQPHDIVAQVRAVLDALYGERAEAIEREASAALGVVDLRDYFRDPRRFFTYHIKRYSKSRRKAPIYWLLQSSRRNYAVWLYYPRIGPNTYLEVARDEVDGKLRREEAALADLRAGLVGLEGAARRRRETAVERQAAVVEEITAFRATLDKIGTSRLAPDHNDGVLISIAPLHELVPWKEAAATYKALRAGQYPWSTMAKQIK